MRRRHVVTGVTLLVLAGVLCLGAVYGVKSMFAPFPSTSSTATAKPSCAPGAQKQVKAFLTRKDVQVSVFNAGSRSGLAGQTLASLEQAGFLGGDAGNAPATAKVSRAVVWTTKANDSAARLVAMALGHGAKVVVTTTDLGPGVDVIVGDRFNGLPRGTARRIALAKPVETCLQGG